MQERIRQYWNDRARQHRGEPAATTEDVYLRELEISTIIDSIRQSDMARSGRVLDVGCGDGYSTLKIAGAFPSLHFLGVDFSEAMIETAHEVLELQPELRKRVEFRVGDVTNLRQACGRSRYDMVISDRCLINLESAERQCHAIAEIAAHTKQGGYYLAVENFIEGHENMNAARRTVGLNEIPIRWHNLYLKEGEFIQSIERFFEIIAFQNFSSSYYFATRVIYSAMCKMRGEEISYEHEIHQLAVRLPWIGNLSPIIMAVLRKKLT